MKLTQEIFAVGKWNGFPFTLNDLRKMAASFNALKDVLNVHLKLGHNDEQPVTDGQPALGRVISMSVNEESNPPKLIAEFDHVPDIVHNAFLKKLYSTVSIELDFDVEHKGTNYDFVVTAVALLGADLPAVNVLNDLAAYMERNSGLAQSGYSAGSHLSFSIIKGNLEESIMPKTVAELEAELALEKAKNVTAQANFNALKTTSDSDKAKFEADKLKFDADQKKVKVDAARSTFTTILEDAVKAEAITPAQREMFSKVLRFDDDDAVLALTEEDVKALFADKDGKMFSKSTAKKDDKDENKDNFDNQLVDKTRKYMTETGEKNFETALFSVMHSNKELAADYVDSNGEVKH